MWSAIKNDLFEFVQTVQSDTTTTLAKVIETSKSNDSNKSNEKDNETKLIQQLTQSYSTYAEDVDKKYITSFQKFQSTFSLSSHSADIAKILERETDVSKYYCDLVPDVITAELFWARYYFKLELLKSKGPLANALDVDEEDEEELTWDDDEANNLKNDIPIINKPINDPESPIQQQLSPDNHSSDIDTQTTSNSKDEPTTTQTLDNSLIQKLQTENSLLTNRIIELEDEVQRLKDQLQYYYQRYPKSESSISSIDEEHSPIKSINYPIESYLKVNESGGESDGMIILSNDLNSDSDAISMSKNMKYSTNTLPSVEGRTSTSTSDPTSSTSQSHPQPSKILQNPGEDDDEEEVGWDDSG